MDVAPLPERRTQPICIRIDPESEALLRAMAPVGKARGGKALGAFISYLVKQEAAQRLAAEAQDGD